MKKYCLYVFALATIASTAVAASSPKPLRVGPSEQGGQVVATGQLVRPAGKSLMIPGSRPVDMTFSPDLKTVYVKDNSGVVVLDAVNWSVRQRTGFPSDGGSMHGIVVSGRSSCVYATASGDTVWEAKIGSDAKLSWGRKIVIPGPGGKIGGAPTPMGIALSRDEKTAYVCLSRSNSLAVLNLDDSKVTAQIPVGIAPYDVVLSPDGATAYVSDWGGRHPVVGERTGLSAGTETLVDERGVCISGVLSIVDLKAGKEIAQIPTGLHPSDIEMSPDGRRLYVANANSDTVTVIDVQAKKVIETILVRPDASLPFGSAPNALALSKDGKRLYVTNGGNNAITVVELAGSAKAHSVVKGFIPTAWYPGALLTDGRNLLVANVKGYGSRGKATGPNKRDIFRHLGVVSKVAVPSESLLKTYTTQVRADSRIPQILRAQEKSRSGVTPVAVPARVGEPSVFEHVVYILKENKTYDQVLGDIGKGNSDPSLCVFGREASPNHHAIAEQFVLLDNYYCNGVLSADGHSWATEGNVTDHLEKSFGGFPRSYSYGDDALTYSSSGLIWDNVLAHGLSFRNYGEMDMASIVPASSWSAVYQDYVNKTGKIKFAQKIVNDNLRRYSCKECPGWNMDIPDAVRADAFLREFREYEKNGKWPDFIMIYLPDDHTSGGYPGAPTPRAQVADNDLALGRIVEAISTSRYWPKTCIFVNEDDPQSGFDHVDGHRSLCFVISPYTKRGEVVSEFFNQTSVLHTMERILGMPPMNQMDAMSPLMTGCFNSKADLTPYTCLANRVPLDEMPPKKAAFYGQQQYYATNGQARPFAKPDAINDDELNRTIWRFAKGDAPYPAEYAGAHAKGLGALGLVLVSVDDD